MPKSSVILPASTIGVPFSITADGRLGFLHPEARKKTASITNDERMADLWPFFSFLQRFV
jgi:hypothetical protein